MVEPRREREPSAPAIELRHLRYFIAVFEELHFGHAAERLHISQPPLSQAIRRLEDELGVPLLERTSRVVNPTEAGRVFAEEARTVLAAMDVAVTEARRAAGAHAAIRIGCASDVPIRRLARFLAALKRQESKRFVTHLMSREELVAGLRRGELDLAILPSDGEDDEIETEPLSANRALVALVSPEHPLASIDAPLGPDSLKNELLLLLPRAADPVVHDRLRMAMEESGFRFRAIHEVAGTNVQDLLLAVAQNDGVALTPDTYMELTESDVVVARPLDPQLTLSPLVVAWPVNHRPWLEDVVRAARAAARDLRSSADTDTEGSSAEGRQV